MGAFIYLLRGSHGRIRVDAALAVVGHAALLRRGPKDAAVSGPIRASCTSLARL